MPICEGVFLFVGPGGKEKALEEAALIAAACDLHIYEPQGKVQLHPIEAMRALSAEMAFPPFRGKRKCFVILSAHRMAPASANALLKTLEEPSLDSTTILVAPSKNLLLPTIISRCQIISCAGKEEFSMSEAFKDLLNNPPSYPDLLAALKGFENGEELLLVLEDWARQSALPLSRVACATAKARLMLERSFPVNQVLEHLFLKLQLTDFEAASPV